MDLERVKLLRLQNQFLLEPASAERVVTGLIGLQAQYGANAQHALAIRSNGGYAADDYVKTWSLRGTLHLHAVCDLPVVLYRGCETEFGQMAFTDESLDSGRAERFRQVVLKELADGPKSRDVLKQACLRAGMTEDEEAVFMHSWGGLFRGLSERGEIAYAAEGNRLFLRLEPFRRETKECALTEMMRRYLAHYGPATIRDIQTFFGMPQRSLKLYLERAAGDTVLIGKNMYYLSKEQSEPAMPCPETIFLAGFDPLMMGYCKTENPFLPRDTAKRVYTNTGIVFPTVLLDGAVTAIWRRAGTKIMLAPLRGLSAREREIIENKAVDKLACGAVKWVES